MAEAVGIRLVLVWALLSIALLWSGVVVGAPGGAMEYGPMGSATWAVPPGAQFVSLSLADKSLEHVAGRITMDGDLSGVRYDLDFCDSVVARIHPGATSVTVDVGSFSSNPVGCEQWVGTSGSAIASFSSSAPSPRITQGSYDPAIVWSPCASAVAGLADLCFEVLPGETTARIEIFDASGAPVVMYVLSDSGLRDSVCGDVDIQLPDGTTRLWIGRITNWPGLTPTCLGPPSTAGIVSVTMTSGVVG
jgi:hypothetical protein